MTIPLFSGRQPTDETLTIIDSMGTKGQETLLVPIGVKERLDVCNEISEAKQPTFPLHSSIAENPVQKNMAFLLTVTEKEQEHYNLAFINRIGSIPTLITSTSYDLYVDSATVTRQVTGITVNYSENSVHNTISFTSIDENLFKRCDPNIRLGQNRIKLEVGGRTLYFLLEKRSGGDHNFTVWGRSLSALEDNPYETDIDYSLSNPKLASSIASEIITNVAVTWNALDWVVPENFEFTGTPIEGLISLASNIGAIVRSDDDGNLTVRNRYPVRPVDINKNSPSVKYTIDTIIEGVSHSEEVAKGYDYIEVYGKEAQILPADIYVEENSLIIGKTVHIRAYWNDFFPPGAPTFATTGGQMSYLGSYTTTITEDVHFVRGVAGTSYPVYQLKGKTVYGSYPSTSIDWVQYSKKLGLMTGVEYPYYGYANMRVRYTTRYHRFSLNPHNVEYITIVIFHTSGRTIAVRIKTSTTDNAADPIRNSLLSSSRAAMEAGRAWLDQNKNNRHIYSFQAPYDDNAMDGVLALINDGKLGHRGNYHIRTGNIIIDGPKVVNSLEVVRWEF